MGVNDLQEVHFPFQFQSVRALSSELLEQLVGQVPTECWDPVFATGVDYLGDLRTFGVATEGDDLVSNPVVREAWRLNGSAFMRRWHRIGGAREHPWAFESFGDPDEI